MDDTGKLIEIESFNLAALDVSAMEVRLELTGIMSACPHVCFENTCPSHGCGSNIQCTCHGGLACTLLSPCEIFS